MAEDDSRFEAVELALRGDVAKEFDGHAAIHHIDITCDACNQEPIIGKRFKCRACGDRDLCETCMRALIAAKIESKPILESMKPPRAVLDAPRPKNWISKLRSGDERAKWATLMQAVPCLHPSHAFSRMDWGPERAVVLTLPPSLPTEQRLDLAAKYLKIFPPSGSSCADVAWIVLETPLEIESSTSTGDRKKKDRDIEDRVESALDDWDRLIAVRKPTAEDLGVLAKRHNILRGKWIAFPKTPEEADEAWSGVVLAAAEGHIQSCSEVKISTTNLREPGYVLCAYTENYLDEEQQMKTAAALKEALPKKMTDRRLLYKADVFTHLGIYSRNEWGLKPTLYSYEL